MEIFPKDRGENKKYLKPTPRCQFQYPLQTTLPGVKICIRVSFFVWFWLHGVTAINGEQKSYEYDAITYYSHIVLNSMKHYYIAQNNLLLTDVALQRIDGQSASHPSFLRAANQSSIDFARRKQNASDMLPKLEWTPSSRNQPPTNAGPTVGRRQESEVFKSSQLTVFTVQVPGKAIGKTASFKYWLFTHLRSGERPRFVMKSVHEKNIKSNYMSSQKNFRQDSRYYSIFSTTAMWPNTCDLKGWRMTHILGPYAAPEYSAQKVADVASTWCKQRQSSFVSPPNQRRHRHWLVNHTSPSNVF